MNVLISITTTLLLLFIVIFAATYWGLTGFILLWAILAATAIWAAVDVGRLKFGVYNVAFPSNSMLALLLVLGMWIVGFPMFFAAWLSIVRGTATQRPAPLAAK